MPGDIDSRILRRFEVRLKRTAEISPRSIRILTEDQDDDTFGDDDELLEAIVHRGDE